MDNKVLNNENVEIQNENAINDDMISAQSANEAAGYAELNSVRYAESQHKRKIGKLRRRTILQLFLIFFLVIAFVLMSYLYLGSQKNIDSLNAQMADIKVRASYTIQSNFEELYSTGDDKVLFYDSALGEVWLPMLKDVPLNPYTADNFVKGDDGFLRYFDASGNQLSLCGIDVSSHQGEIDWAKVKAAGVDFVMIRLGYRGYETGDISKDEYFDTNIQGAQAAGIDVGVYFFSQAITTDEALEEVNFVLDAISPYEIQYPVVYDWEIISETDEARTEDMLPADLTNATISFCENIKNANYIPMVYTSRKCAYLKLDLSKLNDYQFWLADYNDSTTYAYKYDMWQYSSTGTVDGITGGVDMNICFNDYGKAYREANGEA